ncbi:MAG: CBS domain-containing protein [Proteobacteria bacterium]|nr:CBS domain-containing protein [Pseudomonadota bacterium]
MTEKPLKPNAPLFEAIHAIEKTHRRIAVVVDEEKFLLGTLTDGDVRRCLLTGGTLETPVHEAMERKPVYAPEGSAPNYLLDLMVHHNIMAIPLVDTAGRFVKLVRKTELEGDLVNIETPSSNFDFAVIMAGGEGRRLRPLTENIPKPMVDIGGVPLLERQIKRLSSAGITRIYLGVNYLGQKIEEYFGSGMQFGVEIFYLREKEKSGTAGALSLLPERPSRPIVVMNGDILTTSDFQSFYSFHQQHHALITAAAVEYVVDIPFGVIQNEGVFVSQLVEKPSQRFLCNAGIYALSPEALDRIPPSCHFNMTDLIEGSLADQYPVAVFPVHEYWSDIGTPEDLDSARTYFQSIT